MAADQGEKSVRVYGTVKPRESYGKGRCMGCVKRTGKWPQENVPLSHKIVCWFGWGANICSECAVYAANGGDFSGER